MTLLAQIAWALAIIWLLGAGLTLLALGRQKFLDPSRDQSLTGREAPLVSVLMPARDEERRVLGECLRSVLAQDYGRFEVVAVDDRSTDATLGILRAAVGRDPRLRVIEGGEPLPGWLGKPNALRQALAAASGEWVLLTDADMIFHPAALRTAVSYALARGGDAVTFIPRFEAQTFWERVFIPVWSWGSLVLFPPELVNRPGWPLAIGLGGFFLIRRGALERAGGIESVRAEVLEDIRLAENLKVAGARTLVEYAPVLVSTRMYTNFPELWESSTKNWFAIMRFSPALTLLTLLWMFSVGVLPLLLAASSALMLLLTPGSAAEPWRAILVPSLASLSLSVAALALVNKRLDVPARYALTLPLGYALMCAVLVGSAYGVLTGRGVGWKGRRVYGREGVRPPRGLR